MGLVFPDGVKPRFSTRNAGLNILTCREACDTVGIRDRRAATAPYEVGPAGRQRKKIARRACSQEIDQEAAAGVNDVVEPLDKLEKRLSVHAAIRTANQAARNPCPARRLDTLR